MPSPAPELAKRHSPFGLVRTRCPYSPLPTTEHDTTGSDGQSPTASPGPPSAGATLPTRMTGSRYVIGHESGQRQRDRGGEADMHLLPRGQDVRRSIIQGTHRPPRRHPRVSSRNLSRSSAVQLSSRFPPQWRTTLPGRRSGPREVRYCPAEGRRRACSPNQDHARSRPCPEGRLRVARLSRWLLR